MSAPELTVVMPAYNEEEAIEGVVTDWLQTLDELAIDYQLWIYDDGSRDRTLEISKRLAATADRLQVIGQSNLGHGPTVLRGYHEAKSDWVFQIDSDGEIGSEAFTELWSRRQDFDFLLGARQGRQAPWPRRAMTAVACWTTRWFQKPPWRKTTIRDANVPYRLMRREPLLPLLGYIRPDTFAPNVALSGLAAGTGLRICEMPVASRERAGGQPSLRPSALLPAAVRSLLQTATAAWYFHQRHVHQRHVQQ